MIRIFNKTIDNKVVSGYNKKTKSKGISDAVFTAEVPTERGVERRTNAICALHPASWQYYGETFFLLMIKGKEGLFYEEK